MAFPAPHPVAGLGAGTTFCREPRAFAVLPSRIVEDALRLLNRAWALEARLRAARVASTAASALEAARRHGDSVMTDAVLVAGRTDAEAIDLLRATLPKPPGWKSTFESDLATDELAAWNRDLELQADRNLWATEARLTPELFTVIRRPANLIRSAGHRRARRTSCARQRGSRRLTRGSPCADSDPGGEPKPERGHLGSGSSSSNLRPPR
jgi:hypothetical protein